MSAIPLNRQTDIPITAPPDLAATSLASQHVEPAVTWAQAAGTGVGSMVKAAGGAPLGGPLLGFLVAAVIGAMLWMNARVSQAEEAYKAAGDKLGAYDARLIKIELTLEEYANAAKELPEIRKALDRLIEDHRKTAGSIETLERLLQEKNAHEP